MVRHKFTLPLFFLIALFTLFFLNAPIYAVKDKSNSTTIFHGNKVSQPNTATLLRYYPEAPEAHYVGDGFEEVQTFAFRSDGGILAADYYLHGGPMRIYNGDASFKISREGKSYSPDMMDVDNEGNVYVVNWNWGAITKYNENGKKLLDIVCWEVKDQSYCFDYTWLDIAVDDLGYLWVADYTQGLMKFDSSGQYISTLSEVAPLGVDADDEYIYISRGNKVERRRVTDYQLVGEFTYPGVQSFTSLEATNDSKLYAAADNTSLVVFDLSNVADSSAVLNNIEDVSQVKHIESNQDGTVLIKASYLGVPGVYWLNSKGVTGEWKSRAGEEPQFFSSPRGIARDGAGNFYISDTENSRVEKYDSNFNYIGTIVDISDWPYGKFGPISVDNDGSIYLRQTIGWDYRKYDSEGNLVYKKEDSVGHTHHELEFNDSEIVGEYWYSDGEIRYKENGELVGYSDCVSGSLARIGDAIFAATADGQQIRVCNLQGEQVNSIDLGYNVWTVEAAGNRLYAVGSDQKIYQYNSSLQLLEVTSLPPVTDEKFVMYIDMVILGRKVYLVDYMHSRVTLVKI
ncbi:MAG: hypothetical protein QY318_00990 [Candidatus Dojkabacteria bacterium]|nr:MAG: hypothetical protein QY318_00990 [Candidatus Dojkabacteria bacterium]